MVWIHDLKSEIESKKPKKLHEIPMWSQNGESTTNIALVFSLEFRVNLMKLWSKETAKTKS